MLKKIKDIWGFFTLYEKCWFFSILILSIIFAFIFPEEDVNGVNGKIIMGLYLADIFFNILCELLISKQSRWNFIVSLVVEVLEITICLVLAYRFSSIAVEIFFWIPIDIISFVMWTKHKDREQEELTEVRKLSGIQEVICIVSIFVWTIVIGYIMTRIDLGTTLFHGNETVENIVCYLDACCSILGIMNGLFICFRYREEWIAWYLYTFCEGAINVLSGQWVLLVLKAGYLTNTTYGYIKWTKYIKEHDVKFVTTSKKNKKKSK